VPWLSALGPRRTQDKSLSWQGGLLEDLYGRLPVVRIAPFLKVWALHLQRPGVPSLKSQALVRRDDFAPNAGSYLEGTSNGSPPRMEIERFRSWLSGTLAHLPR